MRGLAMPNYRRVVTAATITAIAGGALLLSAGAAAAEQDAPGLGTISGLVWHDLNEDGLRQHGEPGIPDHVIGVPGRPGLFTTTDESGRYVFRNLPVGTYVLQSSDRSLTDGTGLGLRQPRFDPATYRTAPITIDRGTRIGGVNAGFVAARADREAVQIFFANPAKETYQVGDTFEIYGGVVPNGNVADQLGATLTLPEGLRIVETVGGMPSSANGQVVSGMYPTRRMPGPVEFIGARVVAEKPINAADIRLEVGSSPYVDANPANNLLTRAITVVG